MSHFYGARLILNKPLANAMDLPRITPTAGSINDAFASTAKNADSKAAGAAASLLSVAQLLGVKAGDQFVAQVEQLRPLTSTQRSQLLNDMRQQLQQLLQANTPPGTQNSSTSSQAPLAQSTQQQIQQLQQQIQLLQNPGTQWVVLRPVQLPALTPNAPATQQPQSPQPSPQLPQLAQQLPQLAFYSQQPLSSGQLLLISLQSDSRVNIEGSLPAAALSAADRTALLSLLQPLATASSPLTSAALQALKETLSRILPQQAMPHLAAKAQTLVAQLQAAPPAERNAWLSSQLQKKLQAVASQLRSQGELSVPRQLAQSLQNSGVFWEARLAKQLAGATAQGANITADNTTANYRQIIAQLTQQDLKGALLALQHQLRQEPGFSTPATSSGAHSLLRLTPWIANLLGLLSGAPTSASLAKQPQLLRQQLLQQLQAHTQNSLARIQWQQIQTLSAAIEQGDKAAPSHSLQLEIPLRIGQELQQLQLQLSHYWIEDPSAKPQSENTGQARDKTRQWQVMLKFDLAHQGHFYAQLTLINSRLSANFWAEQPATLARARAGLEQLQARLEQEGLVINNLQCLPGQPQQPRISLGYSLVDIST